MTSKGAAVTMSVIIIGSIVSVSLAGISIQNLQTLEKSIRAETIHIPAARIENNLIIMDSVQKGKIEMEFKAEFNITEDEDGNAHLAYEEEELTLFKDQEVFQSKIDNKVNGFNHEKGESDVMCISKTSNELTLYPRGCEQ